MKVGTEDIKLSLGGDDVSSAYLGNVLVYSGTPYDAEVEYIETNGTRKILRR